MTAQLKNNAVGYLAADISASDTGLILGSGEGNAFPTLTGAQYFYATLVSAAGTLEVVKVTARVGDALTVVRAQEGTIANGFATGARVELRVTAASIIDSAETGVYTPAGANAVQTTIQAKLRESVSVKDFGAVGDGVTDDTAAIQAALDSLLDGNVLIGVANSTYALSSGLLLRDQTLNIGIENLNCEFLPSATGETYMLRLDVASATIDSCSFFGILDDTAYIVDLDNNNASACVGDYIIQNCHIKNGRLATINADSVKTVTVRDCLLEEISQFHGISMQRNFANFAIEKLLVENCTIQQCRALAIDGHAIHSVVQNNSIINCSHGYKNQLSFFENNPLGTTPKPNVDREVQAVFQNNNFYIDYNTFNYAGTMVSGGFTSPEVCFSTSEFSSWLNNNISIYNCISGVTYNLYTDAARNKARAEGNFYIYNSPLVNHPPVLRIGGSGDYEYVNETYVVEQFNEHFINSDGPARSITITGCKITLGDGHNPSLTRKILGPLCEAGVVIFTNNIFENNDSDVLCYPIYIPATSVIDNLHFHDNQLQGTYISTIFVVGGVLNTEVRITGNLGFEEITHPYASSTELDDITSSVNTSFSKQDGYLVYNWTPGVRKYVVATGSADGDTWKYLSGTVAHTPS